MIHSGLTDFTKEDIKFFIRTELEKDESEIDTDYVELLTKLLTIKQYEQPKKKSYYKKPLKALIAAAVIVVFFTSAFTVSAQVFSFNIPQKIAQLFNGKAEIDFDLENADTTADNYVLEGTDVAKEIAEFGIAPITFPEEMISGNCKISNIENLTVDESISCDASIDFEYQGDYGSLIIKQYKMDFGMTGYDYSDDIVSGQMVKANGMDVLVFEHTDGCSIRYKDNLTYYTIFLKCDINEAIHFANSIK